MDTIKIISLLTNSGFKEVDIKNGFIYFQDPACIFPVFDTLLDYAWMAVMFLLGVMLFGWAVLYIKNGVKLDTIFNNAKSLILILAVLAAVKPIVDFVYGDNLFTQQCEVKKVELSEVQELLNMRNKKFGKHDKYNLYENFSVVDSGALKADDYDDDSEDEYFEED